MKTGSVVLAGAGCGDASLLTEEVRCCLRTCETLVYDDLIDKSLPDLAPEDCEKIYVGKRRGQHSMKQEQINGLLRQYIPKNTYQVPFSAERLAEFTEKLNHRPRKCLNWNSPSEIFSNLLLHLT